MGKLLPVDGGSCKWFCRGSWDLLGAFAPRGFPTLSGFASFLRSSQNPTARNSERQVPRAPRAPFSLYPPSLASSTQTRVEYNEKSRNIRCGSWRSCGLVGIRTPNLLIRSQMLYPVELRVHSDREKKGWELFPKGVQIYSYSGFSCNRVENIFNKKGGRRPPFSFLSIEALQPQYSEFGLFAVQEHFGVFE